ncbi:hypothetical protein BV898_11293 [Hypsibius exemplaris]|uniref:Cadherin domain-containing protein n=1 Tax=Hypsibius exemplaris TaxID=2072580 RepID=A0A1W0WHH4_HYPEX|nr:hypothetical protein BV898_11293 [Hypsibius exemplaris]
MFNLNSETGVLTLTNKLMVGTYLQHIVAYRDGGEQVLLTATITLKCDNAVGSSSIDFDTGLRYVCFGRNCYFANMGNIVPNGVSITNAYASYLKGASSFGATGYSFTSQGCTAGSLVGTVTALNSYNYGIASGSAGFTISAGGGIFLSDDLTAGNYSIVVAAYGNSGSITSSVRIVLKCNTTTTSTSSSTSISDTGVIINATCLFGNCKFNNTAPVFGSSPYSFSQTRCMNGAPGSVVGTVSATGAVVYYIETGPWSNYYDINRTSGVITAYGSVPTGTPVYLTVTAANQNGVSTNVLVQISTTGCTTTTTATSTSTTQTSTGMTFPPVFPETTYSITQVTCAVSTLGAITATNAASYFINGGNNGGFSINSAGVLSGL